MPTPTPEKELKEKERERERAEKERERESALALKHHSLSNHSTFSLVSATSATALDVCTTMYGEGGAAEDGGVERYYEASASESPPPPARNSLTHARPSANRVKSYENPVLTATSRAVISDIHALARQLSALDVPRPVAMFCTLLRLQPPRPGFGAPLFQALRVWTEIGDLCENESFDGHRKTIVEHTLHILVLPGLHRDSHAHPRAHPSSAPSSHDSLVPSSLGLSAPTSAPFHPTAPGLGIPGTSLTLPSPLHFTLPITTRLAFNEQGRITHHRDVWDVRDVAGLVPGVALAQWVATRVAAAGLAYAARALGMGAAARAGARARAGGAEAGAGAEAGDAMERGMAGAAPHEDAVQ
ncbi:hypothetical protein B0H15DRAFT_772084 [Mycena belliarum]|uniref:Uncharacterized protein n=1 Tax=Mycena belliarum TaxID=1033014 RepID=A0AAD6UC62_9AGAR|nr:hypothetical protein B0H15DRAFT_772084 [Mycena belliae]